MLLELELGLQYQLPSISKKIPRVVVGAGAWRPHSETKTGIHLFKIYDHLKILRSDSFEVLLRIYI